MKQDISKKWLVVTVNGQRVCWGPSKYILSHFMAKPEIQFGKMKVEMMTKKEVFSYNGRATPKDKTPRREARA